MTREVISLENVTMLPSGCAIAAQFREIWIINVYTPSGTARKQDREKFYNNEVPYILATAETHICWVGISIAFWTQRTQLVVTITVQHYRNRSRVWRWPIPGKLTPIDKSTSTSQVPERPGLTAYTP
jgi:hypothetical protein